MPKLQEKEVIPKHIPKPTIPIARGVAKKRRAVIRINAEPKSIIEEKEIDYGNQKFTQEQLDAIWKKHGDDIKQNSGGFSGSVIANCQPKILEDNYTIHLVFRTETNQKEFKRLSEDFLIQLKSELKNNNINFTMEVNKSKAKKVLYSNQDKFDHFSEQFPKLRDWQNKLGLELK